MTQFDFKHLMFIQRNILKYQNTRKKSDDLPQTKLEGFSLDYNGGGPSDAFKKMSEGETIPHAAISMGTLKKKQHKTHFANSVFFATEALFRRRHRYVI